MECCKALEIDTPETGHKLPGVPCRHLTSAGCGIYHDRPPVCRQFTCLWLQGWGEPNERPNLINLLAYDSRENAEAPHFQRYGKPLTMVELCPGAYGSLRGRLLIEELIRSSGRPVGVRHEDGSSTLIGEG